MDHSIRGILAERLPVLSNRSLNFPLFTHFQSLIVMYPRCVTLQLCLSRDLPFVASLGAIGLPSRVRFVRHARTYVRGPIESLSVRLFVLLSGNLFQRRASFFVVRL